MSERSFSFLESRAPSCPFRCSLFDWRAAGDTFFLHGSSAVSLLFPVSRRSLELLSAPHSCQQIYRQKLHHGYKDDSTTVLSEIANDHVQPRSWVAIAAINVVLEITLFAYPVYLVWDLQMRLRSKATVIIGFALRFP